MSSDLKDEKNKQNHVAKCLLGVHVLGLARTSARALGALSKTGARRGARALDKVDGDALAPEAAGAADAVDVELAVVRQVVADDEGNLLEECR
eukprot:6214508-Pleurochrysis_carterae.AAC.8